MSSKAMLTREILNTLESTVGDYFTTRALQESQADLNLANFLFQNEYNLQQKNMERLNTLGIALPEELQTDNYASFVKNSGDDNVMESLGALYAEAQFNNQQVNKLVNEYSQGVRLAQSLTNQGAAATGDETEFDTGYYRFSPDEISDLTKEYPELQNQAYKAGFEAGNTSLQDALKNVEITQRIYATRQGLINGQMETARNNYKLLTAETGNDIMANISGAYMNKKGEVTGLPLQAIAGIFGITDDTDRESRMGQLDQISDMIKNNTSIPNIAPELLSAITVYAGSNADVSEFQEMAGNAYKLAASNRAKEDIWLDENESVDRSAAQDFLKEMDKTYAHNAVLLREYGIAGVIPADQRLGQQAFLVTDLGNKIKEGSLTSSRSMMEEFSPMPEFNSMVDEFDLDEGVGDTLEEYRIADKISFNLGIDINNVDPNLIDVNMEDEEDLLKLSQEFEDAATITSIKELSEINTWLDNNPEDYSTMQASQNTYATASERRLKVQRKYALEKEINAKRSNKALLEATGASNIQVLMEDMKKNPAKYLRIYKELGIQY